MTNLRLYLRSLFDGCEWWFCWVPIPRMKSNIFSICGLVSSFTSATFRVLARFVVCGRKDEVESLFGVLLLYQLNQKNLARCINPFWFIPYETQAPY